MNCFIFGNRQLGVQVSMVYPNASPWNVWFEGHIARFCATGAQAWGWLAILRSLGPGAVDEPQEIADNPARAEDAVLFSELERK